MASKRELQNVQQTIADLSDSLNSKVDMILKQMKTIQQDNKIIKKKLKQTEKKSCQNQEEIAALKLKVADLSDRQRRRNLRLSGFPEQIPAENLEVELIAWFQELGLEITHSQIERVHRAFRPARGGGVKDILIAFTSERKKQEVYNHLRKNRDLLYKGKKIIPKQDLSPESLKIKALLKIYADRLSAHRIKFSWVLPMAILVFKDKRKYIARTPEQAQKMLEKLGIPSTPETEDSSDKEEVSDSDESEEGEAQTTTSK